MTSWPTRQPKWKRRLKRLAIAVVVVAIFYATREWTLPQWGRCLDVSISPRSVDYAYVLGGGANSRPFVAAGLYKHQLTTAILVPQIKLDADAVDAITPGNTETIRRVLLARGVPDYRIIVIPGEVASTFDEAECLARFLNEHQTATVAIVTDDFHTRRARTIFRKVLGASAQQLIFVATPVDGITAENWWRSGPGFSTYLGETFKVAYYWIRY